LFNISQIDFLNKNQSNLFKPLNLHFEVKDFYHIVDGGSCFVYSVV